MARNPESGIQASIQRFLRQRGWLTERMHGNAYQVGIPDLFAFHKKHGFRWIDVKVKGKYSFTKGQCQKWTEWEKHDLGVWIMIAASDDEYMKLFQPPNFRAYWRPSYDKYLRSLDSILDELTG